MPEITAKVLIDNISKDSLCSEWGLSFYIEYRGRKILLDTGTTGDFVKNADALGIHLEDVEYGAISHAHYDHADGLAAFFARNSRASLFMREGTAEDCYAYEPESDSYRYIGIKEGTLEKYKERIQYVSGDFTICPGVTLVPHKTPGLEKIGERANMCRKISGCWQADDFRHEQSAVFETEKGLVIFNSCSHGGADNIIHEVAETFPGKNIYAILGGFHLHKSPREEILQLAGRIRETGIEKVITGHCTGEEGFRVLKEVLGDRLEQLYTGYEMAV